METIRLNMTNYTFKLQMWRFWFKISFYDQFYIEVLKNFLIMNFLDLNRI